MKILHVKEQLFHEIDMLIATAKDNINRYKVDDRKDEAIFEQIKINVYEIFRKMFQVSEKKALQELASVQQEVCFKTTYINYFEIIPSNWFESLEEAKANNDYEVVHIEEMKIKTMTEIKTLFEDLWEADYE